MSKKMLIDATHPEETRVVVIENGRLEELDVDTSTKKQIKGNIYLAKVVRVEPSLQAAFVDYGGNKHGFLAFGEIHPDYYQIPVADREALKEMMTSHDEADNGADPTNSDDKTPDKSDVEVVSESETEEPTRHRPSFFKKYRIQEVIRQGQVMLVQVVKEERGNKGAALTTYLSLAGRYSVLMPNNGKGGGVSRKITNAKDRKSLRTIVDKLPIPQGMSVIIRTAGQGKTKTEIKRDYDYLIKTWMRIREKTLESLAPTLIHEEGDIIKRSLRDVFTPDIEEIWVEGETTYKTVRDFMKMLMPGQTKKIKQYKGAESLFLHYQIENQLEAIHSNIVQLRSGGYLVIDQTEALVAVDVNSGRATREHDIEETALRTNLETCDELARQLKLRDLAGLIVIDFIDMDDPKNNAAVERRLKEALKKDRARIQVGKMSGFGLMEMSRQRLHSSFLESSYKSCCCCGGKGLVRSIESCAMHALHLLEEAGLKNTGSTILISLPLETATYVLNNKRDNICALEKKFDFKIQVLVDTDMERSSDFKLERIRMTGEKGVLNLTSQPKQDKEKTKNDSDKNKSSEASNETPVNPETSAGSDKGEKYERKGRSRNQRRREWKRNKARREQERRLAREQQGVMTENENGAEGTVSQTGSSQEHSSVSDTQQNVADRPVLTGEEKFKVVEQAPLKDYKKKRKDRSLSQNPAENYGQENEIKENSSPVEKPQVSEQNASEITPSPESDTPTEAPRKKRGGWWNKLVKPN